MSGFLWHAQFFSHLIFQCKKLSLSGLPSSSKGLDLEKVSMFCYILLLELQMGKR